MKKIAILQPFYIPWVGVFNQIASVDVFVFGDNFQYSKNSWINRNRIKNHNGGFIWLTIPVKKQHLTTKKISEVEIDYSQDWVKRHLMTIKTVYGKSRFFDEYYFDFEKILSARPVFLCELNLCFFSYFLNKFNIQTEIKFRSKYKQLSEDKSESILQICKQENSTLYLTGPSAQNYLNEEIFFNENISIVYQQFESQKYIQKGDDYVDKLSIIDVLFMNGIEETKKIIFNYKII